MITLKKNWKNCALTINSSINDAIANLQKTGYKIIFVVGSNNQLLGIVTDGDIRRGLLKGYNINSSIKNIIRSKFLHLTKNFENINILEFMLDNEIFQLPLLDNKKKILGFYIFNQKNYNKKIQNKLFILAGGRGSRLKPLTNKTPKPMLKINGKPILEHIILNAKNFGLNEIIISVNYLSNQIKKYFNDGSKFGVSIKYLEEKQPMGTVGSISLINQIPKESIFVINGDIITDIDFQQMLNYHEANNSFATMAVRVFESKEIFGFVKTNGTKIMGFEEKPIKRTYINSGIYILHPKSINLLKHIVKHEEKLDMPDLFNHIRLKKYKSIIYPFFNTWTDIGNKDDYENIKKTKFI